MQGHDRVALCAVALALGVLDGCSKDLVCGVGVCGARAALGQQGDQAAGDEALRGAGGGVSGLCLSGRACM